MARKPKQETAAQAEARWDELNKVAFASDGVVFRKLQNIALKLRYDDRALVGELFVELVNAKDFVFRSDVAYDWARKVRRVAKRKGRK